MRTTSPDLGSLETPVLLLDRERLEHNLDHMATRVEALGVNLRPHVKTAKCVEVAILQRAAGARGITVSTLREADELLAAGFDDILYAVGITPNKLEHVLELWQRGCQLTVILDSRAQENLGRPLGRVGVRLPGCCSKRHCHRYRT